MNWADSSIFYHIYPLGFCSAPEENDFLSDPVPRLQKITEYLPHLERLGIGAVYLGPVWESDRHGYDTADYKKIDRRLGTSETFKELIQAFHKAGIRVVLDGVFHHTGRHFGPFLDVKKNREHSPYRDWFYLRFDGDSPYQDGFWYEGWEGHYELVKLNLQNPAVRQSLFHSVETWIQDFNIDGIRLDVAYSLDHDFLRELSARCKTMRPDFWLLGEMIHGDYNTLMQPGMLDSVTNYECYKGLYSSFNSRNLFEIAYSLNRQFGAEPWCLYTGRHLYNFAENHDVTRIASILQEPLHLPLLYTLLYTMPGIPSLYYGGEWGQQGKKEQGDNALRPAAPPKPDFPPLAEHLARLAQVRKNSQALCGGAYRQLHLTNQQMIFERALGEERIIIGLNISPDNYTAYFDAGVKEATDMLTGSPLLFADGLQMAPYSSFVAQVSSVLG